MLLSTNMAEEGLPFLCYKVAVIKSVFHQKWAPLSQLEYQKKNPMILYYATKKDSKRETYQNATLLSAS